MFKLIWLTKGWNSDRWLNDEIAIHLIDIFVPNFLDKKVLGQLASPAGIFPHLIRLIIMKSYIFMYTIIQAEYRTTSLYFILATCSHIFLNPITHFAAAADVLLLRSWTLVTLQPVCAFSWSFSGGVSCVCKLTWAGIKERNWAVLR